MKIGVDVWAPAASRIAGRPVAKTAAGRAAQTIQTSRTCGRSLFTSSAPVTFPSSSNSHVGRLDVSSHGSVTSGSSSPSVHLSPSSRQTQTPTCNTQDQSHGSLSSSPHTSRTRVLRAILLQCAHTMMSASRLVPVSLFPPGMVATCSHL